MPRWLTPLCALAWVACAEPEATPSPDPLDEGVSGDAARADIAPLEDARVEVDAPPPEDAAPPPEDARPLQDLPDLVDAAPACLVDADCDNGDPCDGAERCDAVLGCVPGAPVEGCCRVDADCDDLEPCNGVEACGAEARCVTGPPPPGCCAVDADCDDGDVCNGVEACGPGGACQPGVELECDDGDLCDGLERCDPAQGCLPGQPLSCADFDPCNGEESCDPAQGCLPGAPVEGCCLSHDDCAAPETCGGGGEPQRCGCARLTCDEACGAVDDGCGGILDCGPECTDQQRCEGGECVDLYPSPRVGAFYLLWHAYAAEAMSQIPAAERRSVEAIIRDPSTPPSAMLQARGLLEQAAHFHYHLTPRRGFYCMYRPREGEAPYAAPHDIDACQDTTATADAHARQLWGAGVDFVFLDVTNLPYNNTFTDVLGVRPVEVLFEEWRGLRERGVMTPQIAVWAPVMAPTADARPTYEALLDGVYNDPRYDDLVLRDRQGRKVWFAVDHGGLPADQAHIDVIEENGGRRDIVVVRLWGNLGQDRFDAGLSAWMQPCESPGRGGGSAFTTIIDPDRDCNQRFQPNSPIGSIISTSVSYQINYASLPFAAAGRNDGLTFKKQFATALRERPDWILINAWNEFIAQPQRDAGFTGQGSLAQSMGHVPAGDDSDGWLWVDTYGAAFSRDIEPTVEYGDRLYEVMRSCIRTLRAGGCDAAPEEDCCVMERTHTLVWSARAPDPEQDMDTRHVLTTSSEEGAALLAAGFEEVCSPGLGGPPEICTANVSLTGDGPFLLLAQPGEGRRALYRCDVGGHHEFFSPDAGCEGQGVIERLGWLSEARTSETPRPLSRCYNRGTSVHFHWLDERCPTHLPNITHEAVLGFVR